jgi:hypothetical protein
MEAAMPIWREIGDEALRHRLDGRAVEQDLEAN